MIRKKKCGNCANAVKLKKFLLCDLRDLRIDIEINCRYWSGKKYNRKYQKLILKQELNERFK